MQNPGNMEETIFKNLSHKTLQELADAIEEADTTGERDVEYQSGVLTLTLPGGKQYVVNQHVPMRQIWLSSPVSGAYHFDYAGGIWRSTRGEQELVSLLKKELQF